MDASCALLAPVPTQIPANRLGKAVEHHSGAWALAVHMGDLEEPSGFWFLALSWPRTGYWGYIGESTSR